MFHDESSLNIQNGILGDMSSILYDGLLDPSQSITAADLP